MKTLLKLIDLKTLVAGIIPVAFGSVYSLYRYDEFSLFDMFILMIGIVLIQSCANMINDLFDHDRGADNIGRADEKALAAGEISKREVKKIVCIFLAIDVAIGIYYSVTLHWSIIVIGIIGAVIMYKYSAGDKPISYTPFGEVVAGVTMGVGIMTTVIFIQSGRFSFETIIVALPTAIYIGTILLTNNISDHKEDKEAGRHTLPIIIGVKKTESLWVFNCYSILVITAGLAVLGYLPFESLIFALVLLPHKKVIGFKNVEKIPANKGRMMGLIGQVGLRIHIGLIAGLLIAYYVRPLITVFT